MAVVDDFADVDFADVDNDDYVVVVCSEPEINPTHFPVLDVFHQSRNSMKLVVVNYCYYSFLNIVVVVVRRLVLLDWC